jgi:hypothetical protein
MIPQQSARRRYGHQESCVLFVECKTEVIISAFAFNFSCREEQVNSNVQLAVAVSVGFVVDKAH